MLFLMFWNAEDSFLNLQTWLSECILIPVQLVGKGFNMYQNLSIVKLKNIVVLHFVLDSFSFHSSHQV